MMTPEEEEHFRHLDGYLRVYAEIALELGLPLLFVQIPNAPGQEELWIPTVRDCDEALVRLELHRRGHLSREDLIWMAHQDERNR